MSFPRNTKGIRSRPPSRSPPPPEEEAWFDDFGNPAAIDDLDRSQGQVDVFFTETPAIRRFLGNKPSAPYIAGAKGTGKSLLLFKKLVAARALSGSVVLPDGPRKAFMPAADFANHAHLTEFRQLSRNGEPNLDAWAAIWEWALLKTIVAGWYRVALATKHNREAHGVLAELVGDDLHADPYDLIGGFLSSVLDGHRRVKGQTAFPSSVELRQYVTNHCARYPQTFFFLDNHDETFERSPKFWVASSYGAFLAINQIHQWTNRRVHGFLTLRTEVMRELQRSQQYPQWSAGLFRLLWEDDKLLEMFRRRAARLRPEILRAPTLREKNPLAALFGPELFGAGDELMIRNPIVESGVRIDEAVESYILRHTLRRPRDLIVLGNHLIEMLQFGTPRRMKMPEIVRTAVDKARSTIGQGYLAEMESQWPWAGIPGKDIHSFIGRHIRRNVLRAKDAEKICREFLDGVEMNGQATRPIDVLIRMGLIGYPVPDENHHRLLQRFLRVGDEEDAPQGSIEWFFVHPVLYGNPFHIKPVSGQVIGPDLPFSPSLLPAEFEESQSPATARTFSWLHLSDLHFGHGSVGHRIDQRLVLEQLIHDAVASINHGHPRPDAIFVTGDVAFSGNCRRDDEYTSARLWLDEVAQRLEVPRERVFVVPGNHDVSRRADVPNTGSWFMLRALREGAADLDETWAVPVNQAHLIERQAAFLRFAAGYGPHHARGSEVAEPFWVHRLGLPEGAGVRVIGLNTALLSGDERSLSDDRGRLRIGRTQLAALARLGDATPGDVTIVLSHHPFIEGWLSDEQTVNGWAQRRVALHLCGHVHRADARQVRRGIGAQLLTLTAGAGHEEETPGMEPRHGYSFASVAWDSGRPARLTVWPRRWSPVLNAFTLDVDNVPCHEDCAMFTIDPRE